jgi:hypothetical protein
VTQRGRAAAIMRSVAAEERGERAWPFLRLLVRGEHERAVGMGDDLIEVLAEAKTLLGQAPGTTSDPAERRASGAADSGSEVRADAVCRRLHARRSATVFPSFIICCMLSQFEILLLHARHLAENITPILGTAPR